MATDTPTNEPSVIAAIRADMARQEEIASQHASNNSLQVDALSTNTQATAQGGVFTSLEEKQAQLYEEFATIRAGIIGQMHHYDIFCDRHKILYSANWNALLTELDHGGYLQTPLTLSMVLRLQALHANK